MGGGGGLTKADTDLSWGAPAGLPMRGRNDENLVIFRRAVGINSWSGPPAGGGGGGSGGGADHPAALEEGRQRRRGGIYAAAAREVRRKAVQYHLLSLLINASHFAQIIIGASLTALGPSAGDHVKVITVLGAINTVLAGVLALIKGQGLPDRLYHDRAEYRRLVDWIEQTEALLAVGVIGRDRKEVGVLVETAFKKYNAARQCEESNLPENYVRPPESDAVSVAGARGSPTPSAHVRSPSPYHH
ncbi:uncharacterized protein THITE_2046074 [Thermothielavioides terrestris NRRL 8126]|uniref:SMODS and SLOG-associating 2TM effector domain-containing protein n=1 Tax=Thermothielavioides terrestris (strain ATCC 38088 / NRRL 8126) TaxID=578455 RepID=G2R238_THETT|nr:uncharacterized protein THITE_2046074 [Thermothielavioides terrestris NRRL 8126]AEO66622.1 hypothetical protein THITE_2046074 [Thermothielavioides terrestris NRRL 8126]